MSGEIAIWAGTEVVNEVNPLIEDIDPLPIKAETYKGYNGMSHNVRVDEYWVDLTDSDFQEYTDH